MGPGWRRLEVGLLCVFVEVFGARLVGCLLRRLGYVGKIRCEVLKTCLCDVKASFDLEFC